jgi:hypothetical protein
MLVSGRPDNIDAFAEAGGGVARLVQEEAAELGGALDAFRATEGWSEYLALTGARATTPSSSSGPIG